MKGLLKLPMSFINSFTIIHNQNHWEIWLTAIPKKLTNKLESHQSTRISVIKNFR